MPAAVMSLSSMAISGGRGVSSVIGWRRWRRLSPRGGPGDGYHRGISGGDGGDVSAGEISKKRSHILQALSKEKERQYASRFEGTAVQVLFEESQKENLYAGYTPHYLRVEMTSDVSLTNWIILVNGRDLGGPKQPSQCLSPDHNSFPSP